jgi:hypothetical protein
VSALDTLIPTGGVGACLAAVVFYLLKANRDDRVDYQQYMDRAETRGNEAAARAEQAVRALDDARAARHLAEDAAAKVLRELADSRARVRELERQLRERGAP